MDFPQFRLDRDTFEPGTCAVVQKSISGYELPWFVITLDQTDIIAEARSIID